MKKVIFLTNLIAISTVLGMQNDFTESHRDSSRDPMRPVNAENLSASARNYEALTDRDWILKIVQMNRNEEDFNASQNSDGQTILMCAAKYTDCKIMQQILNIKDAKGNRQINVDAKDENGDTALSIAAKVGDDKKILLLLKNGADVELAKEKVSGKALEKLEKIYQQVQKANKKFLEAVFYGVFSDSVDKIRPSLRNDLVNINARVLLTDVFDQDEIKIFKSLGVLASGDMELIALLSATTYGCENIVDLLLKQQNIDVNIKSREDRRTALMLAIQHSRQNIANLLLKHQNINVNLLDYKERNALIYAAIRGNKEIFELLIKKGIDDINHADNNGKNTALIQAASRGYEEIVELLLKQPNINVNIKNENGYTALVLPASKGHKKIVEMLLNCSNIDINAQDNLGNTALIHAVYTGRQEIVDLLLKRKGIDVNSQNEVGKTALIYAVIDDNEELVKLMLNYPGIEVDAEDNQGLTAFAWAIKLGREEIVKQFLKKGADINKRYADEFTGLMYAAEEGHSRIVNLLLNQPGIDINAKNTEGETALDCASRTSRRSISRLILSKIGLQNQQQDPFIEQIKKSSDDEIRKQFLSAVSRGDINEMDLLLEDENTDINNIVNARNKNGDTSLIIASDKGNLEAVKLLLECGADLSLKDANGDNALIRAAEKGHFDVVEELLFRKANINSTGQHKKTALMAATENGHTRVIKLLIKKGAKISVKNDCDKTALDIVNEKIKKPNNTNNNYESIKNILEKQNKQSNLSFGEEIQNLLNKWEVITDNNFEKDLGDWEKNDPIVYDKIKQLVDDIKLDPFRGVGRVERLTGDLEGLYSRRINKQNRLVYEMDGEKVILKSCKGHYEKEKRNRTRTSSEK